MAVTRASNLVDYADAIPSAAMCEYCDWNDVNSNFGDNCLSVLSINSHSLPKKICRVTCLHFSNCK